MQEDNTTTSGKRDEQEKRHANALADIRRIINQLCGQLLIEHNLNLSLKTDRQKLLWALSMETSGMVLNQSIESMSDHSGNINSANAGELSPDNIPAKNMRTTFLDTMYADRKQLHEDFCIELELNINAEGCKELAGILAFAASILALNLHIDSLPVWLDSDLPQMEKTYTDRLKDEIKRMKNTATKRSTSGRADRVGQASAISSPVMTGIEDADFEIEA